MTSYSKKHQNLKNDYNIDYMHIQYNVPFCELQTEVQLLINGQIKINSKFKPNNVRKQMPPSCVIKSFKLNFFETTQHVIVTDTYRHQDCNILTTNSTRRPQCANAYIGNRSR